MNLIQDYPKWLSQVLDWLLNALGLSAIDWSAYGAVLTILWAIIVFTLIAIVAQASVIFLVLMERKVLAWFTQRKGPNRVGPWGLLQTLADGVKLLFKEDIMPKGTNKFLFTIAPALFFLPSFVFFGLIPFTDQMLAVALPAGALFVFAISSISVVGLVLAGWASNNKYSLLGGMRSAAQAISYEIPLVMSVLTVVLFAGTMNIGTIVQAQQGPLWNWYGVLLTPVSLAIFFISALAEVNRIPFDLPEAESELVSGYNTEYSGMKFALFFLAEYASLFAMSAFTAAFFLGGYYSPFGTFLVELVTNQTVAQIEQAGAFNLNLLALQVEMLFWFMMKTYFFIFLAMWIRATLPRLKPDQLMGFSWKFLIPLSLINIFVIAIEKYMLILVPQMSGMAVTLPVLQSSTLVNWVIWVVAAVVVFGLFFFLMSRLLTEKLEARLARR
ncbi:MAG: subunit of NADH:ubiquinone oxidoreductase [Vampirovibrio sp.]|jgi:NADH-quinone oxidoreductase subunit H|nr:subunit of NADH:ubiquinone oxidoreductase [Vampirovibrio sp.]